MVKHHQSPMMVSRVICLAGNIKDSRVKRFEFIWKNGNGNTTLLAKARAKGPSTVCSSLVVLVALVQYLAGIIPLPPVAE